MVEVIKTFIELIAALGGITVIGKVANAIYKSYRRKQVYQFEQVQQNHLEIYENLENIVEKTSASKTMIVCIHNGGSKIAAGKQLFLTIIYEVNRSLLKLAMSAWKKQEMDYQLTKMYSDVMHSSEKILNLAVKDITEGLIKNESDGAVENFILAHVHTHDSKESIFTKKTDSLGKTWFLCVVFEHADEIKPHENSEIRVARNRIGNILKKQYQYD